MATSLSVNAVETNLQYFLGTDQRFVMTDLDSQDMDGWALSFMVKKKKTDADADAKLHYTSDPSDGVTVADSVATVSVAAEDTDDPSTHPPGTYYWELKRTDPGAEAVYGFGEFVMRRGVHRE